MKSYKNYNISLFLFLVFSTLLFASQLSLVTLSRKVLLFVWTIHFVSNLVFLFAFNFQIRKPSYEKWYAAIALPLGVLYLFTMTPFSIPDECYHYQTSYELSNIIMLKTGIEAESGNANHFDYSHFPQHHNNAEGYERIVNCFTANEKEGDLVQIPSHRSLVYFVMQLPQAFGISLGRSVGANFITIFYLGRFMNLITYLICAYFAIRIAPVHKVLFVLISLMPMTLHQAASFSYDCITNALTLLMIALFLRSIFRDEPMKLNEFFLLCFIGTIMGPSKVGYLPLILLTFLIPSKRFFGKKARSLCISGILISAIMLTAFIWIRALYAGKAMIDWGRECYPLSYIWNHPLSTFRIFGKTLLLSWYNWLMMGIGSKLSGLTIAIPEYICVSYLIILLLAGCTTNKENNEFIISRRIRISFLGISLLCIILIMGGLFVNYTDIGSTTINGIQGRYFIPLFPLLFLCIETSYLKVSAKLENALPVVAVFLNMNVLSNILIYTVNH